MPLLPADNKILTYLGIARASGQSEEGSHSQRKEVKVNERKILLVRYGVVHVAVFEYFGE